MSQNVLIWDLPTRLFHWLLVAGITTQWLTAEYLDNAIDWHFTIGYCLLGLIAFRLVWGLLGTHYARFSNYPLHPIKGIHYSKQLLRKDSEVYAGHNPIGSWAVIAMLLIIALQAISGLFVTDDIFSEGPYYSVVSAEVKDVMAFIHFNFFDVLLWIIGLHIAAALFYQFYKRQTIITAMFSGKKETDAQGITQQKLWLALVIAIAVAAMTYWLVIVLPPEPEFYY
ncbi:cytochrome b/b6 domain-containing protein [Alteromonas sp. ASW11-36]|uniref:Cytochrome b/b6 domain-containing protein n=1 Tax=Alteromonas arenosi TaxID=3055817 RepID=A0ABT7SUH5_9ALTE|nr:cytochrome b/b6 domain-containing protein [Alteromonas sp. ASW11-36]MDM7859841.1 cytochrome b/b6 domain-containing protein [Alteromonas sp. ASW11-36]